MSAATRFTALALMLLPVAVAGKLIPSPVATGVGLQASTNILLDVPAPPAGLTLTVKSNQPDRLALSNSPDHVGGESVTLNVRGGLKFSPDFFVQGLASSGEATYTVSGEGFSPAVGVVRLGPTGIVFVRGGVGFDSMRATIRQPPGELRICAALLTADGAVESLQPVVGLPAAVRITNSNPGTGALDPPNVAIPTGSACAATYFRPLASGSLALTLTTPRGFAAAPRFNTLNVTVAPPGLALTTGVSLGRDLQIEGAVNLGEAAPEGGATVTLKSADPKRMLLAPDANSPGAATLALSIPSGGFRAHYYLQALAGEGVARYSATAPGYQPREAEVQLTPSGLVLGGPQGPPDEAVLFRQEIADGPQGFVANLSQPEPTPVRVYTVHLDPVTRRGADITVQPLRAGFSLDVSIENANPAAGEIGSRLRIEGGASNALTHFKPRAVGETTIAVVTPQGFTKAASCAALTVMVRP